MSEWGIGRKWVPVFIEKEDEREGKGDGNGEEEREAKRRYEMYASEHVNVRSSHFI